MDDNREFATQYPPVVGAGAREDYVAADSENVRQQVSPLSHRLCFNPRQGWQRPTPPALCSTGQVSERG